MKNFAALGFCLFLFINFSFAQNPVVLKDEFGPTNLEEMMMRLDVFAYENLSNNPDNKLLVKIEGGTNDFFAHPFMQGAIMKAYLTNMRKISDKQILIQYCDIGKEDTEIRRQLFLVPPGANVEDCNEEITPPTETKLYAVIYRFNPYDDFDERDGCCYIEGAGEAINKIKDKILLDFLAKNPGFKIYLIGYAGHFTISKEKQNKNGEWITAEKTKTDPEKIIDGLLKNEKQNLLKKGIDSQKIYTIKGGYREGFRTVELYLVPKDGKIPKPKPDYFPSKLRNK